MRKKLIVGASLLAVLQAAGAAAPPPPAALAKVLELAALPDGGWLGLDKKGVRLYDAGGKERAMLAIRAKQLDLRASGGQALAVVLDGASDAPQLLKIDLKAGSIARQAALPAQAFGAEAVCLFLDRQGLAQLFVLAKDGQAQQWLLDGARPALVRRLSVPAGSEACRVDDRRHTLYTSGEAGVWAYEADSEAPPAGQPVGLRKPYGTMDEGGDALAVLPDAVAVIDASGKALHVFESKAGVWRQRSRQKIGGAKGADALAVRPAGDGAQQLLWRDGAGGWNSGLLLAHAAAAAPSVPHAVLTAQAQTDSVPRFGDVADDPAIWVHPADPDRSRVLGTNKKQGLHVYDMQGRQLQFLEVGRLNNVDLRQGVKFGGQAVDLAVATQRDDNSVAVFGIDGEGTVAELVRIPTTLDKIYGICLYQPPQGGLETFVNDADGRYQQIRIERSGASYAGKVVREFRVATQPEGCVADDANGRLFVGEERKGLWVMAADAAAPARMEMVLKVGAVLHADTEGMGIYHGKDASYLVLSSQGSNSYVVLDALPPYRVRGTFQVGFNVAAGIDGTSETDGLDVSSKNLGKGYEQGLVVIQDGYKRLPDGPQNFKYVRWADIAGALHLK
jgi:3-phytase